MKLVRSRVLGVFLLCCPLSVFADEISYNYWSFGGISANRQSDYTADDPNLEYELEISLNWYTFSYGQRDLSMHFWTNLSRSRNISANSAYTLNFVQFTTGLGIDYTSDVLSTFFRVGQAFSEATFKTLSRTSSGPLLPEGDYDIFEPPNSIFDQRIHGFSDTKTDYGDLIQMGIRYRVSEGYEIGASILVSNLDSFGTEFSGYAQRDFGVRLEIPGIRFTHMSLKLSTTISDPAQTIGLSLVFRF